MPPNYITTRILVISDTHCAPLQPREDGKAPVASFKAPLPSADLLIHCGDLTMTGQMHEYHQTLDMLKEIDAPVKLVIAGNHDLSLDGEFVQSHRERDPQNRQPVDLSKEQAAQRVEEARHFWTAADGRAKREGITFLHEGTHSVELLNGAVVKVYASPYTPEFYDWAFAYEREEDRFNESDTSLSDAKSIAKQPIPTRSRAGEAGAVDIVMTHGPPWLRLDPTTRGDPAGCPHLLRAVMAARPQLCLFGHIHEGWGAERVQWSEKADGVARASSTITAWKQGGWEAGIANKGESIATVSTDSDAMKERHAAFVNLSGDGDAIKSGKETLFINAAIMDVQYSPVNSPWVIDLDLPMSI